jgi:hypothetical protein
MDAAEIAKLSAALDASRAKWREAYEAYGKVSAAYDASQTPENAAALEAADERLSTADRVMAKAGRALKAAREK